MIEGAMPKPDEVGRRHAAASTWRRFAWPCHPSNYVSWSNCAMVLNCRDRLLCETIRDYIEGRSMTRVFCHSTGIPATAE